MRPVISLVPVGLGTETPPPAPPSEAVQKIKVQAISLRDALLVGIVTGFALAVGNFLFTKAARRFHWK